MANILICDDSAFTRTMIKDILKVQGHKFLDANDGDVLLRIIKEENFDLILLDLLMPKKDGFEVLRELKKMESKIPVIIISADVQDGSKQMCLDLGANAFLNKPPVPAELIDAINNALKR